MRKEIKLQEGMDGVDNILYKTDVIKSYSESDLTMYTFKSVLSPPMYICGIHNFNKKRVLKWGCFLYVMTSV